MFRWSFLINCDCCVGHGSWLSGVLREQLETRIEAELRRHLLAARELIQITPTMEGILDVDPVANRLGQAIRVRVTVMRSLGGFSATQIFKPAKCI